MSKYSSKPIKLTDLASSGSPKQTTYVEIIQDSKKYICIVEPDGDEIILSTDVKATKYPIGILFSEYDETRKGLEVRDFLAKQNLFPEYTKDKIEYSRRVAATSDLAKEVERFTAEVVSASASVDKIIIEYLASVPRKLPSYRRAGNQ